VVRDRGGDGNVKDNRDWWKVTEARIIKKTSGQLQRAWYLSNAAVGERALSGQVHHVFWLSAENCAKLSHGAQESLSYNYVNV